jgi:hypothetical protein
VPNEVEPILGVPHRGRCSGRADNLARETVVDLAVDDEVDSPIARRALHEALTTPEPDALRVAEGDAVSRLLPFAV